MEVEESKVVELTTTTANSIIDNDDDEVLKTNDRKSYASTSSTKDSDIIKSEQNFSGKNIANFEDGEDTKEAVIGRARTEAIRGSVKPDDTAASESIKPESAADADEARLATGSVIPEEEVDQEEEAHSPENEAPLDTIVEEMEHAVAEEVVQEKVRDNEKYSVFFRMLRMGVPSMAVKNKMIQKGVDPGILDLGEDALMTRVLALERAFEHEKQEEKKAVKKGETIHWEAVPRALVENKFTVFGGDDFALDKSTLESAKDLLELFVKKPEEPKAEEDLLVSAAKKKALKNKAAESVLDAKRAQSISIAMKKLKISADQPAKFTWALREMNDRVLNANAIEIILASSLWPVNDDELKALKDKNLSGNRMADPDRLILFIIETVPDVVSRVHALAFRWEFETSIVETAKTIIELKNATKLLSAHENLRLIIRSALLIGNAVNEESGVQIAGCTIHSLIKLAHTKTIRDKNLTVLDCVVIYLQRNFPNFMKVDDLLVPIGNAKKIELENHIKAVRDMRRGIESLRRIKQMEVFAFEAMRRLDAVESELQVARDFYERALAYFCVPSGEIDSNDFFTLVYSFLELWGKSVTKRQKDLKAQQAQVMAAAAAAKAEEKAKLKAAKLAEAGYKEEDDGGNARGKKNFRDQIRGIFGGGGGGGGGGGRATLIRGSGGVRRSGESPKNGEEMPPSPGSIRRLVTNGTGFEGAFRKINTEVESNLPPPERSPRLNLMFFSRGGGGDAPSVRRSGIDEIIEERPADAEPPRSRTNRMSIFTRGGEPRAPRKSTFGVFSTPPLETSEVLPEPAPIRAPRKSIFGR